MKKKHIPLIAIISILAVLTILIIWHSQRRISLIDLQKEMLVAKTDSERQKILECLDKYYLTMDIPDSIRQRVQAEVYSLIKQQENSERDTNFTVPDTNVYVLENQLKEILREAMIARVRGDELMFQAFMQYAKTLADTVDIGTDNDYWRPWVVKVTRFDAHKALRWLLADRAEWLCRSYIDINFLDAEKYGALGIQLLEMVKDFRLRLDISQRLFFILYQFREMYDLSCTFAKREIQKADELKYHLRANGLLFYYATALWLSGRNQLALVTFFKTISRSEKNSKIPDINWYKINGYLGIAKANWQLGNYEKTIAICDEIEKFNLYYGQKIELCIERGLAHRNLGNFDKAKEEYNKALYLAIHFQDINNQIIALKNLGTMYHRLTEYDKATDYYIKAMKLLLEYNPQNIERRCRLLISIAETKGAQNEIDNFNDMIQEVNDLIKLIYLPAVKAELYRLLGRLNMKTQKYQHAYDYLQNAVAIYKDYGLLRAALETEEDLVECLIALSRYKEAKDLLIDISILATNIYDAQRKINALGMMAEIAWKERNVDKAIQKSNKLIKEIETISNRFTDIDNLTSFRQKVYDYLQNAVIYELRKCRIDSAFIKLDYIKARAAKNRLKVRESLKSDNNNFPYFIDVKTFKTLLNEKQLVINYFITYDTLYAFILNREDLNLLRRPINIKDLRNIINTYMHSIHMTAEVFQNYQSNVFTDHYDSVATSSQQLYQILLGWPELQTYLQNTEITYIIPDGVLYEIPFSCLMNSKEEELQFLIQQTAIVNLPSTIFLQSRQNRDISLDINNKNVLISADRRFPRSHDLINFVKKRFPSAHELVIDKNVITKEDILSKLNQEYDIYIFLGHSEANKRMPDSSFFELTAIRQVDSVAITVKTFWADFKNIDWSQTQTVLLIGCETAQGKRYKGTGLAGIQQGILTAGAQEVLASLWKIDENKAISQTIDFLKSRMQQKNSVFALQDTQIKTIRNLINDSYYKNPYPYFWGSFTLSQTISY